MTSGKLHERQIKVYLWDKIKSNDDKRNETEVKVLVTFEFYGRLSQELFFVLN